MCFETYTEENNYLKITSLPNLNHVSKWKREWSTNHVVKCLLQFFNALKLEEKLLISPVSLQIINVLSIHIISHPKHIQFCTTTKISIIKQKNWVIKHMWDVFEDLLSFLLIFYSLISKIIHVLPHQVCPHVKDHLSQDFWCCPHVLLDYHPCWPDLKTKWVAKYSKFNRVFFFFFLFVIIYFFTLRTKDTLTVSVVEI